MTKKTNSSAVKIHTDREEDFLIVGIGASAGGIQALQTFFKNVPKDSGCAYVVILHMSPDHDSKLVELLNHVTKIPVSAVTKKTKVRPNQVYVISPNQHLTMVDGHIIVSKNLTTEDRRAPVDIFFRTLADSHGPSAVCVVLSGTGANGSMGLKRIKEQGGAAYVQNPKEAEFNEMPRNSIETELVDEILPVAEIPGQIITYNHNRSVVKITEHDSRPEDEQQALRQIFTEIRLRTGHDFTNYKRPTLLRRIERRINLRNHPDLASYAAFLQDHPQETQALLKDLLISVTNFFRDPKAFFAIETEVIPAIMKGKDSDAKIRIWAAGCATGEEAYSLAMICAEKTAGLIDAPKIQIFATDIDEAAIAVAREGLYTINDAADVSPERLAKFFLKEADGYRVRREVREMVLFATHNFLKDPPFSRLNLITCRNALIYLNQQAQERVLETFHFALNPGGFLFLGSAESIDGANDLYLSFNKEFHIFQSRQVASRNYPVPESVPSFNLSHYQQLQKPEEKGTRASERITFGELHLRLLEEYASPSVVVNEEYEIVHMSKQVGSYFEFKGGEPTQNLLKVIRPELRLEIRSALYKAIQHETAVESRVLALKIDDKLQSVKMHVRPIFKNDEAAKGFILIVFEPQPAAKQSDEIILPADEPVTKQLEDELFNLKAQLRNSTEQHELQAEELKASNEELQAINEELRSAAEELETSKEELQSINEELRTVNQELKVKIDETTIASNNLHNLINSADVGTIFLDRSLHIKLFTPAVSNLFNLRPSDYGRPITDITNKIDYDGLTKDAESVLERLTIIDREVTTTDDRSFLIRLLPYRTKEDRIDGVVITFFDITKRRQAEQALMESTERFRTLTDVVPQLIWATDRFGRPNYFNQRWYDYSGMSPEQSIVHGWQAIVHPDDEKEASEKWVQALSSGKLFDAQFRLRNASGDYSWHIVRNVPLKNNNGTVSSWFGSATDIQNIKRSEELRRNVADRLQLALEAGHLGSYEYDFKTGALLSTAQHKEIFGYAEHEPFNLDLLKAIVLPEDQHLIEAEVSKKQNGQTVYSTEYRIRHKSGAIRWIKSSGRVLLDKSGKAQKTVGITIDITELKEFAEELSRQVNERTIELQRTNEDLIQFAHVASHDLKEPARKIKTYASRLSDEFGETLPEKGNLYLDKIQKATNRMFAMIEGVLNYSMHDVLEESFTMVDLSKIINQIEADLELIIVQKKASLIVDELPVIRANSILMHQLFYNLINNSLKFSKPNELPVIKISAIEIAKGDKTYSRIELSDNGIGFEREFENKIFETFSRLNPKDEYEGTGLGLALCKKIVDRHRGFIFARGIPGKGAIFTILLPV
jgi:two-component system CheB/CheR fusion protein